MRWPWGIYEVTFREYDYYVWSTGAKGRSPGSFRGDREPGRGDRPVTDVSWNDAKDYVKWLSERTGQPWRLPSEAEWEYAARAGTGTAYWWGREAGKGHANCAGCDEKFGGRRTAPAGSYPANPWGLHDTAGNVWEWVEDAYAESGSKPATGAAVPRVLRGGSWSGDPAGARAADRDGDDAGVRNDNFGFRVCRGSPIE